MQPNLKAAARDVLLRLSAGETVNRVTAPPMDIPKSIKLLGSGYKTELGENLQVYTAILYLAPQKSGGIKRNGQILNVCPWATPACVSGCLGLYSGRLVMDASRNAQRWKTALFAAAPKIFFGLLRQEVAAHSRRAQAKGYTPAVRLDGTSDLGLADRIRADFPEVYWYDYTKSVTRIKRYDGSPNRHLTFSASEASDSQQGARAAIALGLSVAAIVPRSSDPDPDALQRAVLGETDAQVTVSSFDETDARFLDAPSSLGTLKVKGGSAVAERIAPMVFNV